MRTLRRRKFLGAVLAAGASLPGARQARAWGLARSTRTANGAPSTESRIEVQVDAPIGRIAPEIHGHFAEQLGGVIYDGIWVGEQSKIPNIGGIRRALVEALRRIKPPVVRWPGGCFADSYGWRDGVGPRAERPRRTSFWAEAAEWTKPPPDGPWKYDTNQFGTHEFVRFCRLIGAQPYLAANVRSATARDFSDWVEYCNAPAGSTTGAERRAAGGDRDPFNVRYWAVGNESWGCGGSFTPEEYASEFRRFTEWVPAFGQPLSLIGAGPAGGDVDWTKRFFAKLAERHSLGRLWGWSLHDYAWNVSGGRTSDWQKAKGDAVNYSEEEWYELLSAGDHMESLIAEHWAAMGEFDPDHRVKLVVDEWGAWYRPGSAVHQTHLLGQQSTLRDAVLAGRILDVFHRHPEKVAMANLAQLVNCLQALFLTHEDKMILTPTFHVFEMYAGHQGGQSVRTEVTSPRVGYLRNGQPASLAGLSGSASLLGKQLTLTVTNPDLRQAREAAVAIRGATLRAGRSTTLGADDPHAHNSFDHPTRVTPRHAELAIENGRLVHLFPAASVTRLELALG